jgi:hypothetical protein
MKKIIAQIILSSDSSLDVWEKVNYVLIIILKIAPIAFVLNGLNIWFKDNSMFFSFIVFALLGNMLVGVWKHRLEKTFNWEEFFKKNITMWIIIILVYPILEMIRQLTGDNIIGEGFKVVIQVATFLYPGSKILKNCYIISNGQFPPEFIMTRLYRFEKTGNADYIFNNDKIDDVIENEKTEDNEQTEINN